MRKNGFHRLPVVDGEGRLVGLITEGLVEEHSAASATSLSIFELNYLLSRRTVGDIMIKEVHTTVPDIFLEEAAKVMIDNDIAVLPVLDKDKKVIGIITEKDMFQAFVDLLGYGKIGTRFVIRCIDQPGYFQGIIKLFADNFANVESLAVFRTEERGTEAVVKATGSIPVERMRDILIAEGYEITEIVQTTIDGKRIKHPTK
jgi:acetoin utilization protein AcuB